MAYDQKMYRDPLDWLLQKERTTCRGCMHESKHRAFEQVVWICLEKDEKGMLRNHGARCRDYEEKGK